METQAALSRVWGVGKLAFALRFADQTQRLVPDLSEAPVDWVMPLQKREDRLAATRQLVHRNV